MSVEINGRPEQTVAAQTVAPQTMATQVSEIVGDLQRLIEQEILLMRREIEHDLRCRARAAALLIAGVWILAVDVLMLGLSCVYLAYWLASPPGSDPSQFPLWACYAAVTAALALIGAILTQIGLSNFKSCSLTSQFGRL
jgi:hypothetical protein